MSPTNLSRPELTCPEGGTFYVCAQAAHRFIGCCGVDACAPNGCPAGQLQATSFNTSMPTPPDQQCNAGQFYTCAKTDPTFWGCCTGNPCVSGKCMVTDLAGAMLSSNPALADPYISGYPAQSSNQSTTESSSGQSVSGSEPSSDHHHKSPIGTIVGASLGAFFFILICVIGAYFFFRRRAASKKAIASKHGSQSIQASLPNADPKLEYGGTPQMSYASPGGSDAGAYVYNPNYSGSPVMSMKVPEDIMSHGHQRYSTVSSLGAQTTQYSPPIGSPIQELDGSSTKFQSIAELPAEGVSTVIPEATLGAVQ